MDLLQIYNLLLENLGKQNWWPTISKNKKFEVIVGAILTQNTSWKNVEKAIKNLNKNNLLSEKSIKSINEAKLAEIIKSSGYHNQKAKKLKEFVNFLDSNKKINKENLLKIWGIGQETADSILLYAYNKPIFVIDAYTKRIMNRIGFKESTYNELQDLFTNNLPKDLNLFKEYHALLVRLGKYYCKKKPLCNKCPINKLCIIKI